MLTRGIYLVNIKVPHDLVMGCHVAPINWTVWLQNCLESIKVEPVTSGLGGERFGRVEILALSRKVLLYNVYI
jgi:hypothetical protein